MKSIYFPAPVADDMIRAILEGRKTVTRRAAKLKYSNTHLKMFTNKYGTRLIEKQNEEPGVTTVKNPDGTTTHTLLACIKKTPPYRPGVILYVRETWCRFDCGCCEGDIINGECLEDDGPDENEGCWRYRASHKICGNITWHPSIHMPREAARIFLRVTDVRAERLWDITNTGLINDFSFRIGEIVTEGWETLGRKRWNSTLKPADRALYSWDVNPWVWVIEFERCDMPKENANG